MDKLKKAPVDPNIIEASATKELFISMLVKDITLNDAIGDLIDNAVDAAVQNSPKKNDLSPFTIVVKISKKEFTINDNCGGLETEIARKSAFYFGKPKDYVSGDYSIGQFGIGMKRAFFKIGEYINVESVAQSSSFKMHIDVVKWNEEPKWNFHFDELKEKSKNKLKDTFTEILVTELNKDVKEKFLDDQFLIDLKKEISFEHRQSLKKGLKIKINDSNLCPPEIGFIYEEGKGQEIKPSYWKHDFDKGLSVEVYAGLSEDDEEKGGWYIFCNERLIVRHDTSDKTGWSGKGKNEMPKWHAQFHRFRGYVFFKSKESSKLPWNTTKTGMDMDSPDFLFVKSQMIIMAKQVKKAMDDLKGERAKGNPKENQTFNLFVEKLNVTSLELITTEKKGELESNFSYPEKMLNPVKPSKKGAKILFYKPASLVKKVKNYFQTDSNDIAGEKAFDYFIENEIED